MIIYFISVFIVFILFIISARYLQERSEGVDYIWLLFISVIYPIVLIVMVVDTLIDYTVQKLKEKQ